MTRTIQSKPVKPEATILVPGSKSYTHRTLIAAALSNGTCQVDNALRSEDTLLTLAALKQMGIAVDHTAEPIVIHGRNGRFDPVPRPIDFRNSGTSMRLFGALVVLGQGPYTLTGTRRMCERPMQALLNSLIQLGVPAHCLKSNGCPPVIIVGGGCSGGRTAIDCSVSSQYLSALLLIAPCLPEGMSIDVSQGPVSKPYIDMTVDIMRDFGVCVHRQGYEHFEVPGAQTYQAGRHTVEPDGSNAGYFWAAAAVTGSRVKVAGVTGASRQGDVGLVNVLEQMGCRIQRESDGIAVTGGDLRAVTVDMGHMPDVVPTLAVVAAFAQGTTIIRNVAHLRAKECDRLAAVARELSRMGIETRARDDELHVVGGRPQGAAIDTYDDHRMAMSFAVAGLKVPEVRIRNPECVAKSFPDYWEIFEQLYQD